MLYSDFASFLYKQSLFWDLGVLQVETWFQNKNKNKKKQANLKKSLKKFPINRKRILFKRANIFILVK